ncbi:MAG: carbohydrate-binding module family 14 protein [Pseudomonadota bacterium]
MRVRLLLATLVVAATPGLAMAYCSGGKHDQVTMSCPVGQVFDTETSSCKALPTG